MTAQVTATPGGSEIITSGSVIPAQLGVVYQIADVGPDGEIGPVLAPPDLTLQLNEPGIGDLSVTLPDGTVIVFLGMLELFGQGTGIAGADGTLIVASLEDAVAAAAGDDGGTAPDGGGSSGAFNNPTISDVTRFGPGASGVFDAGAPLDDGGDFDGPSSSDPNLILSISEAVSGLSSPELSVGPAVGLEDAPNSRGIFLNILVTPAPEPGAVTVIQIDGIPVGATLFNDLGPIVTNVGPGALSVIGLSVPQLKGIGITPPENSDADFDIVVTAQATLDGQVATVSETETVIVKAVADGALITMDGLSAAAHAMGVEKNSVQIEGEGRGKSGVNDTSATAQDLGTLIAPTTANPAPVIAVDGWVNVNDANDVDVYRIEIAEDGSYTFDIDFGDLDVAGNVDGRIDDANLQLFLFDAAGNQIATDDDTDGQDPELTALLPAGTYFVAVTAFGNDPIGGNLNNGFDGGAAGAAAAGDYRLLVQADGADNRPGDMFTVTVLEDNAQDTTGMFVDGATEAARSQGANIDLAVSDMDGSESLTRVSIDIDTPPPGLKLNLNGDGAFDASGDVVTLAVTRFGLGAGTLDVTLQADPVSGALFFDIDPGERVQAIDLSEFSWVIDRHSDQDFGIEITARSTETNPSEGTTLDESQVATPHAYQTATIMVNTLAVADKAEVTVADVVANEDNAIQNGMGMLVDGTPRYGITIGAAVTDNDGSESITEIRIDGDTLPAGASFDVVAGSVTFANGTALGPGLLQATASLDGDDLVLTFDAALRLQDLDIGNTELGITLPQHLDGRFSLETQVTTTETNPTGEVLAAGATAVQTATFDLVVGAVADKASITTGAVNGMIVATEDDAAAMPAPGRVEPADFLQTENEGGAEANDDGETAQALGAIDGTAATALTVSGVIGNSGGGNNDVDFYNFTVTEAGIFVFDIDDGSGDGGDTSVNTTLSIFDGSGTLIASNDDGPVEPGSTQADTGDAFLGGLFLEAGTYSVAVSSFGNDPVALANAELAALGVSGDKVLGAAPGDDFTGSGQGAGDYRLQIRTTLDDKAPAFTTLGDVSLQEEAFSSTDGLPSAGERFVLLTSESAANGGTPLSGQDAILVNDVETAFGVPVTSETVGLFGSGTQVTFFAEAGDTIEIDATLFVNTGGAPLLIPLPTVFLDDEREVLQSLNGSDRDPSDSSFELESDTLSLVLSETIAETGFHTLTIVHTHIGLGGSGLAVDNIRVGGIELGGGMVFDRFLIRSLGVMAETPDQDGSEGLAQLSFVMPDGLDLDPLTGWFLGDLLVGDGDTLTLPGSTVGGATTVTAEVDISNDGQTLTLIFPDPATPTDQVLSVDASALGVQVPRHLSGAFQVDIEATTQEFNPASPGDLVQATQTQTESFTLRIEGVADKPVFEEVVDTSLSQSGEPVSLEAQVSTPDDDGSEGLSQLKVSGLPAGSALSFVSGPAGARTTITDGGAGDSDGLADGVIVLDLLTFEGVNLPGVTLGPDGTRVIGIDTSAAGLDLQVVPPAGFEGRFTVLLVATSTELAGPVAAGAESQTAAAEISAGLGPPLAPADDLILTNNNGTFEILASALIDNDIVTGGTITAVSGANVTLQGQSVVFSGFDGLANDASGTAASFSYTVTDVIGNTATATVDLVFDRAPGVAGPVDGITGQGAEPGNGMNEILIADPDTGTTLLGGDGDDQVFGDAGPDRLFGGDDDDQLFGGSGIDRLAGDAGNDRLFGDGEGDVLLGGSGEDELTGGAGDDDLSGNIDESRSAGDANVADAIGADLVGENDRLFGGTGDDDLAGDVFGNLSGGDATAENARGGNAFGGNDRLDGGADADLLVGDARGSTNFGGNFFGGSAEAEGARGGDVTGGDDRLDGGDASAGDLLIGDAGFDLFGGNASAVDARGGDALGGDDTLENNGAIGIGDAFGSLFGGNAGADGAQGGAARGGSDTINGTASILVGDVQGFVDDVNDRGGIIGGNATASGARGGEASGGNDTITNTLGGNQIGDSGEFIIGGTASSAGAAGGDAMGGDDTLRGGSAIDSLVGDAVDDLIGGDADGAGASGGNAVGGDDRLFGGSGGDELFGDTLGDLIDGTGSNGGSGGLAIGGDDSLFGGSGNDTLVGDAGGSDNGRGGDDLLNGGADTDLLTGNSGADTFAFDFGDLQGVLNLADIITDYEDGIDGITLNLNGGAAVTLSFAEQAVAGVGTGAVDTVISIQGSGEIVAVLQDVNAAGGATIDNTDVTITA